MFWRTLIAVILTVAAAVVAKSATVTIAVFVIAMVVVFVFEGVRIVPQQNAWVVERLGKFSRILERIGSSNGLWLPGWAITGLMSRRKAGAAGSSPANP